MSYTITFRRFLTPCDYHHIRKCKKGESCEFTHYDQKEYDEMREKYPKQCVFIAKRGCVNGRNCQFSHLKQEFQLVERKVNRKAKRCLAPPRILMKIPCKYFNGDGCYKKNCAYSHTLEPESYDIDDI